MSATEVAADLRMAAGTVGFFGAGNVELADRLEALADSFDQPGTLGFDRATGEMVALEPLRGNIPPVGWRFPAAVSAQERRVRADELKPGMVLADGGEVAKVTTYEQDDGPVEGKLVQFFTVDGDERRTFAGHMLAVSAQEEPR